MRLYFQSLWLLPVELCFIVYLVMVTTTANPFGFYVLATASLTGWLIIRWLIAWQLRR